MLAGSAAPVPVPVPGPGGRPGTSAAPALEAIRAGAGVAALAAVPSSAWRKACLRASSLLVATTPDFADGICAHKLEAVRNRASKVGFAVMGLFLFLVRWWR